MKVLSHNRYKEEGIKKIDSWKITDEEKKNLKKYIKSYESGDITGRLPTNPDALIERILQLIRPTLENVNIEEGTEKFRDDLLKDKIKKSNGKKYALKTKKSMIEASKKYYEIVYPDKPELSKPFSVKIILKENDDFETFAIPSDADKLRISCGGIDKRGIIALLMGGVRIEEALNITEQDIKFPEKEESFVQIMIKNNLSKTKGRNIKIYYDKAVNDLYEFLQMRKSEGMKPNEPLINMKYQGIRDFIISLGKKSQLNIKLTPHSFRHSVATYLSSKLNRHELCYYFGWRFSSNMPDKYINRSGFTIKDADKKIETENITELKSQLSKESFERKMQSEEIEKLKADKKKTAEQIKEVMDFLRGLSVNGKPVISNSPLKDL